MNKNIRDMTLSELEAFLGLPGNPKVCTTEGCYNETTTHYVVCVQCLYGAPERADAELIAAKKRYEKLKASVA